MPLCETELRGLNVELTQALETLGSLMDLMEPLRKAANLHQESCQQLFAEEVEKAMTKLKEVRKEVREAH